MGESNTSSDTKKTPKLSCTNGFKHKNETDKTSQCVDICDQVNCGPGYCLKTKDTYECKCPSIGFTRNSRQSTCEKISECDNCGKSQV